MSQPTTEQDKNKQQHKKTLEERAYELEQKYKECIQIYKELQRKNEYQFLKPKSRILERKI
jgi:hypothetical protein